MKRSIVWLLLSGFAGALGLAAHAQTVPDGYGRQFSITAGGTMSAFQPDYAGGGFSETAPNRIYGLGTYVDVHFTHWFQVEGEGHWLRFNQLANINESTYLIGPRLPIQRLHFWRATPYAKALIGIGRMNFEYGYATGSFTALAYGGGLDWKLNKRISVRAVDFEYQQWPRWVNNQQLFPYGISAGVGYKIF